MRWIANIVYLLVGLFYSPFLLYEMVFLCKNRRGWRQRFGFVPQFDPSVKRVWVHAVSLGEMNATRTLVERLRQRLPNVDIVFSTTTDTGFARGVELYGESNVFRFPLDLSFVISRVLKRVNPSLVVLVEQEVWYNILHGARRRGIPVAIVNGRLTERSAGRLALLGGIARSMFSQLNWVGAQDETIAERFVELGTLEDRIEVTSSLKWDSASVADSVDGCDELAAEVGFEKRAPLWVCGSTGPGEEKMILDAYALLLADRGESAHDVQDDVSETNAMGVVQLAIVPRKPERFDEVARLIESAGFDCIRRSEHADGATLSGSAGRAIILGDTMGELRKFYCLADVVFVGRTLVPMGGSDPMEVAALSKAMIVGPHTENFVLPVRAFREKGAIREIASASELSDAVGGLLVDAGMRASMGKRARDVVIENQGATERTVDALVRILDNRSG
jgi:3-deoxy-D-manno-octulosonic-acid transferase